MFARRLLFGFSLFVLAACDGLAGPKEASEDLAGVWRMTLNASILPGPVTCTQTAVVTIEQSGSSLNGSGSTTGSCQPANADLDPNGTTAFTGRISGDKITLEQGDCRHEGTISETHMSGSWSCEFTSGGRAYTGTGTWQATRMVIPEHLRDSRWIGTTDQADPRGGNGPISFWIVNGAVKEVSFWAEATVGCRRASTGTLVDRQPGWEVIDDRFTLNHRTPDFDNPAQRTGVQFRIVGKISNATTAEGTLDVTIKQQPDAGCDVNTGSTRWRVTRQ